MHDTSSLRTTALSATLHCLLGCSIGEIVGLMIGTWLGLGNFATFVLAITLAFVTGYALSLRPLLHAGLGLAAAAPIVFAADTLSITAMEVADNTVIALIPGAMNAGLGNWLFWAALPLSLTAGFFVALPVNYWLLRRGRGHALMHQYHDHGVHGSHGR